MIDYVMQRPVMSYFTEIWLTFNDIREKILFMIVCTVDFVMEEYGQELELPDNLGVYLSVGI
jgi:hypothetical protein